jgi:hypothetical protein
MSPVVMRQAVALEARRVPRGLSGVRRFATVVRKSIKFAVLNPTSLQEILHVGS